MQKTIAKQLSQIAQQNGQGLALRDKDGEYSYAELDQLSDQIAQSIRQKGGVKGDLIGMLFEQSKLAVAATLGALKAGCAYVPLDSDDPQSRLSLIINDCQPSMIVTGPDLYEKAKSIAGVKAKIVGVSDLLANAGNPAVAESDPDSSDLACVIYTSGSTGSPKGVCHSHANMIHFASEYGHALGITAKDTLSLPLSLCFAASNMTLFGGLMSGASVSMINLKKITDYTILANWLESQKITVYHSVASVLRQLLKIIPKGKQFSSFRIILTGGEPLYSADLEILYQHIPTDCLIFSRMASTENHMTCLHRVDRERDYGTKAIPVGKPVRDVDLKILRDDGSPTQVDEVGNIVITSPFLTTGYINNEQLNSSAFGIDEQTQIRCFRPGDMGYLNPRGELHFSGRNDLRFKIRGYSVEPGEIESKLTQLPFVHDAVVVARRDSAQENPQLVAFLHVPDELNQERHQQHLANHVRSTLPNYMWPSRLMFLADFPKTATGKTDRKALAELPVALPEMEKNAKMPWGDTEVTIAKMFAEVLKVNLNTIPRQKTFFDLGGDSLGITDLTLAIQKQYSIEIPQQLIVEHASVQRIAEFVDNADPETETFWRPKPILTALSVQRGKPKLFLVHGRSGLAMVSPDFAKLLGENHSLYVFRARGQHKGEIPHLTIEGMAAEYWEEIVRIQPEGPYFLAGLCVGGIIARHIAQYLAAANERVAPVIMVDPRPRAKPLPPEKRAEQLRLYLRQYSKPIDDVRDNLAWRMKDRVDTGRHELDTDDQASLDCAARVEAATEIAELQYKPSDYPGDVILVSSEKRLRSGVLKSDFLRGSNVNYIEAGRTHKNTLDAKDPRVIAGFREALRFALSSVDKVE